MGNAVDVDVITVVVVTGCIAAVDAAFFADRDAACAAALASRAASLASLSNLAFDFGFPSGVVLDIFLVPGGATADVTNALNTFPSGSSANFIVIPGPSSDMSVSLKTPILVKVEVPDSVSTFTRGRFVSESRGSARLLGGVQDCRSVVNLAGSYDMVASGCGFEESDTGE